LTKIKGRHQQKLNVPSIVYEIEDCQKELVRTYTQMKTNRIPSQALEYKLLGKRGPPGCLHLETLGTGH
jgi:hypothetical protein